MLNITITQDVKSQPDNIIKEYHNGTTFTVKEYMIGTKTVEDIVTERIIRELGQDLEA
jgi:hypothetical protein